MKINKNLLLIKRSVLLILCFLSSLTFSQPMPVTLPKMVLVEHRLVSPGVGRVPFYYKVTLDLDLIEVQKEELKELNDSVEDFVKKFDEERIKLEGEYQSSSGENKIKKAKKLITFIVEQEARWQKFIIPYCNKWEGDYKMILNAMNMVSAEANGFSKIDLSGTQEDPQSLPKFYLLNGTIDGGLTIDFNSPIPGFVFEGGGTYTFSHKLTGKTLLSNRFTTKQEFVTGDGQLNLVIGAMGFGGLAMHSTTTDGKTTTDGVFLSWMGYGEFHADDSRVTGYIIIYYPYSNMYMREDINKPIPKYNCFQILKIDYLEPEVEEIDWEEYKNKYYKYYVKAIDAARTSQYNTATSYQAKETKANDTYKELITAKSYGQQLGIKGSTYSELKLIMKMDDSLFDKWFKNWFKASDNRWKERVTSASDDANKVYALERRMKNVLQFFQYGEMMASDKAMKDLGLYNGSSFVCDIIKEYFVNANNKYCVDLTNGGMTSDEYQKWIFGIYNVASIYGNQSIVSLINSSIC